MIKLKNEINKSATMRELRKEAEKMYEHSFMCDERIEDFMYGAETLFNLLRLPRVIECLEQVNSTLERHGKVEANTDLHNKIRNTL